MACMDAGPELVIKGDLCLGVGKGAGAGAEARGTGLTIPRQGWRINDKEQIHLNQSKPLALQPVYVLGSLSLEFALTYYLVSS